MEWSHLACNIRRWFLSRSPTRACAEVRLVSARRRHKDGEEETSRYEERVKKQLTRQTVAPELLRRYLQQLQSQEAFANLDVIVPYFEADTSLPQELLEGMRKISAMLDDQDPETSVVHGPSKASGSRPI